jgi:hypothetical protein
MDNQYKSISSSSKIVSYTRFQGHGIKQDDRNGYIEEIEFLSRHPYLLDVLKHQLRQIKTLFNAEIEELKRMDESEARCSITPMNRLSSDVLMVVTNDPDHKDLLLSMERHPKYRDLIVRGHVTAMRALELKEA